MNQRPVLSTLCYVKRDQRTLMLHRVNKEDDLHEGKWNGLGGKFERGETPEECVRREVREEARIRLRDHTMRGLLTFPEFDGVNDWYVFVFTSRDYVGTPQDESREGRLEWIRDEELLDLNLWEGDEIFLRWMEDPTFFSGKFVYEGDDLRHHEGVFYPAGGVSVESFRGDEDP